MPNLDMPVPGGRTGAAVKRIGTGQNGGKNDK